MKLKLFSMKKWDIGILVPAETYYPHVIEAMSSKGITFYAIAGATYGGFGINFGRNYGVRITFGWISFGIIFADLEVLLVKSANLIKAKHIVKG